MQRVQRVEPQQAPEIGELRIDSPPEATFERRFDPAGEPGVLEHSGQPRVERRHPLRPEREETAREHAGNRRGARHKGSHWNGLPACSSNSNATGLNPASNVTFARKNVENPLATPVPVILNVSTMIPMPGIGAAFLNWS